MQSEGSRLQRLRGQQDLARFFDLPIEQLASQVGEAVEVALRHPKDYESLLNSLAGDKRQSGGDKEDERALRVRAGIDALQISVGERWRRYVRSTAVWVSGVAGVVLARYSEFTPASRPTFILAALVLGGAVAWFARDIAALVERWRR